MSVKPLFTIEPFKLTVPAQRSAPTGLAASVPDRGFSGRLGQAAQAPLDADQISAASELMLNQGLMDILADGEPGEADSDAGDMNSLLLATLLGDQAGLTGGPGGGLAALARNIPGGAPALAEALRQVLAASDALAPPDATPADPARTPVLDPAALSLSSLEAPAGDPAPGLARSTGLKAYARALPAGQAEAATAGSGAASALAAPRPDLFSRLLGRLSARFESGNDPAAVAYDRVGGTSYGIYQLSSRAGTMDQFLGFLQARRPDWAAALEAAGPANTGSSGGAMPATWRALAAQDPEGFSRLQHEFIGQSHFLPAAERIQELTGLDLAGNPALAEVLWSTAVQHGASGAASIVSSAAEAVGRAGSPDFASNLVGEIYKLRAGRFGSSDAPVQEAVRSRLLQEREEALALLRGGSLLDSKV